MNKITEAIKKAKTKTEFADVCGVSRAAVENWVESGRLPRTEWTGETNYSKKIYDAFGIVIEPFKVSESSNV